MSRGESEAVGRFSQSDRIRRLIAVYLLKRGTIKRAWSYPAIINQTRLDSANLLDGYYLNYSRDADYGGPKDSLGVPLVDYTGRIGIQYNPWFVGHYALACYDRYRTTQEQNYLERFLRQADWFVQTAAPRQHGSAVWEYSFRWSQHTIPPWISSLAQSMALSTLLRAWLLTEKSAYLALAERALVSFATDIPEGGARHRLDDGAVTFEESAILPASTVLNGFVFSIWGVYEFLQATGDRSAQTLVDEGLAGLRLLLPKYDMGFWSKYSLEHGRFGLPAIASVFYHNLHVAQAKIMARLFGDDPFEQYARRWEMQENSRARRSAAILIKTVHKLLNY